MSAPDTNSQSLEETLSLWREAISEELRVSLPGVVVSYDAARGSVIVQPVNDVRHLDADGNLVCTPAVPLEDVPVLWPGRMEFDIAAGDPVLLVFCDTSIDRWLSAGGTGDPGDSRTHTLSDAVAIPGLRDFTRDRPAALIRQRGEEVEVGGTAELAFNADLRTLVTELSTISPGGTPANNAAAIASIISKMLALLSNPTWGQGTQTLKG